MGLGGDARVQSIPRAANRTYGLKILDNFVLDIAGLRFHHRIQELTPHGRSATSRSGLRIQGPNARGHHGHGDLPSYCSSMLHISAAVIYKTCWPSQQGAVNHRTTGAGEIPLMYPIHRHRRLLRTRRQRPRRRAAEQSEEFAPLHSITSSARASSVGGTSRRSALAVVRLMTRLNLVGCSTGMSLGFAPRRILSTIPAVRLHWSGKFGP